jgi:hypothetical protein
MSSDEVGWEVRECLAYVMHALACEESYHVVEARVVASDIEKWSFMVSLELSQWGLPKR